MHEPDDNVLLHEYAVRDSGEAFAALVTRHINKVYSVALRHTRNPHSAEEITQAVFVILARKADKLHPHAVLSGWLYETARLTAVTFIRSEIRRARREQEAHMQTVLNENDSETWTQIAPLLDAAMAGLNETDRHAVVLRFFDGRSMNEVGAALGASEDAAKKRVTRALEKLRTFFTKRGIILPATVLTAAISTNSVQAAPVALAKSVTAVAITKGAAASASALTLIKGALKLMAWPKTRTAMMIGASMLLAAGTAGVIINSVNASPDDIINKLERQSGKKIVWEKYITLPPTFVVKDLSFEEALDQLAADSGAYWTVDYAVYDSNQALRQLLAALHDGNELQSAGWTNFSSRPLKPAMHIISYGGGGGMRMGTNTASDVVGMIVVLNREASVKQNKTFQQWFMQNRQAIQNGQGAAQPPDQELRTAIESAMKDGVADGVLAPERLLADLQIIPKINFESPVPASSESAQQLATAAHANWTTIYTLRKSPINGAGIKLIHAGRQAIYGDSDTNHPSPETITKGAKDRQFTLTPRERAAHEQAIEAAKAKQ